MNHQPIIKDKLITLYLSGKSMSEIARMQKCSIHKIVYWMGKYKIKRRTHSEAAYLQFNPNGDPFSIKQKLNQEENFLLGLGLGIYWGEGEKVSRQQVRVANTDPAIIKIFIKFLTDICRLNRNKLLYSIVCFNDTNPDQAKSYWAKELNISEEKFGKIVQIPPQGKGNYRRKSLFGVCTICVGNVKLKAWILNQINDLKRENS